MSVQKSGFSKSALICRRLGKRVYETPGIVKKISAGAPKEVPLGCICIIFRALFFEHDAKIRQVASLRDSEKVIYGQALTREATCASKAKP